MVWSNKNIPDIYNTLVLDLTNRNNAFVSIKRIPSKNRYVTPLFVNKNGPPRIHSEEFSIKSDIP